MLTKTHNAEAELKLKNLKEEQAVEDELKSNIKKAIKTITESISSLKTEPKKQLELLRNIANQQLPSKILNLENTNTALTETQEQMKHDKDKLNKEALMLVEEKGKLEGGIDQIKKTILKIQTAVRDSVHQEVKKRQKIESDLEKSLDQIRNKIKEFQEQSTKFTQENAELQAKIEQLKGKLASIQDSSKVKENEKDEQTKEQRQNLSNQLKVLEVEVQNATRLSKEYSAVQKKNFDNKIALYLKIKKFPEFSSSFEGSAKTLNSCKEEIFKGVQRMNAAGETIEQCNRSTEQSNNLFFVQLRKQKENQAKIEQVKKEKEAVRANIIQLQNKTKERKTVA